MRPLLLALALAGPAGAVELNTTCLPGEYLGDGLQLAVDGLGAVHLARVARVQGVLLYTHIAPDDTAQNIIVEERLSRFFDDEVRDLGLAVDGGPHICAYDAVRQRFDVHDFDGDTWTRSPIDAGARIGESCDLARTGSGLLAAWHGAGILRAALRADGGGWTTVDVDALPGADVGGQPSIAVGDGVVAIAHLDATRGALRVSAAEAVGPFAQWRWQTVALDTGGWRPAAAFDGETLRIWHGGVPAEPDIGSDVALYATAGPAFGPLTTAAEPGVDLGGSLDAAVRDGIGWLFTRRRTRSALFPAFDGMYLATGPTDGAFERQIIAESGAAGQRHIFAGLQVALDPFGLPVLAWFDDAAAARGAPAAALTCYARALDTDGDAVPDLIEAGLGTDPEAADTDGDGRTDGEELLIDGTDPGGDPPVCADEVCDGRDDDCDARIDEGLDGAPCETGAPGQCAAGLEACVDGRIVCVPQADAGEEACDGLDEDCDGAADEGASSCGEGRCAVEVALCLDGAPAACVPGAPAADDATCDDIDDDCDGIADEDYAPQPVECGVGACRAAGQTTCVAGVLAQRCVPRAPAGSDTTCDGIDGDCDGLVDEGAIDQPVRCGVGACVADGVVSCVDGGAIERCAPGPPAADDATCDAVDDDCDGAVDEDSPVEATACGEGACAAVGERRCIDGRLVDTCLRADGRVDDDCDGVDDDCDGAVDEAYTRRSTCGVGPCRVTVDMRCVDGVEVDPCAPNPPLGPDETCDLLDDDCDGAVDEAVLEAPTACGVGACAAAGVATCEGGVPVDTCVPGAPEAGDADCDAVDDDCDGAVDEGAACDCPPDDPGCGCRVDDATCDGVDDDCDGSADEDHAPEPVTCGVGACAAEGEARCVDGAVIVDCAPAPAGTDDDCDAIDDDCDGLADEAFPAGEIECGVGACAAVGTIRCLEGRILERCTPRPGRGDDPICNGIDDDCDGTTDEGARPEAITCGVGACLTEGQRICRRGRYVDRCTPGAPAAGDDTCDGIDDDCDGIADEDVAPSQTACGEGACAAFGTRRCMGGAPADDCVPGAPAASDGTCDGIDDDCDGIADEDYASQPVTCGVGVCAVTIDSACVGGVELDDCQPGPPAVDDGTCDGIDTDCDGAVDEDVAPSSITCGRGACLAAGERRCVGGEVVDDCIPGPPGPFDAVCDGIDADCDGAADEDFVGEEQRCGVGACARIGRAGCADGQTVDGACIPAEPGEEACDGADRDCDGVVDEGCAPDAALDAAVEVDAAVDAFVEPDGPLAPPPLDAAIDAVGPVDAMVAPVDATPDAIDGMPDAFIEAPDGMPDAAEALPDATTADAMAADPDAALDHDAGDAAGPDGRPGPPEAGLDRPDAVRLDYALDPLEDLSPPREFGCFVRVTPGGSGGWPALALLAALLLWVRRRRRSH